VAAVEDTLRELYEQLCARSRGCNDGSPVASRGPRPPSDQAEMPSHGTGADGGAGDLGLENLLPFGDPLSGFEFDEAPDMPRDWADINLWAEIQTIITQGLAIGSTDLGGVGVN
jgi:hypothetical protein